MADKDLAFNVTALDNASKTFVKLAAQVDRMSQRLDRLDRKDVNVNVNVDTKGAQAHLKAFEASLDRIGTRTVRATAKVTKFSSAVYGLGSAVPMVANLGVAAVNLSKGVLLLPGALSIAGTSAATLATGVHGLSDAFKAQSQASATAGKSAATQARDQQVLTAALDKLAPSARNFVAEIHGLSDGFHNLRLDVQQQLFRGLGQTVSDLATQYLPALDSGMSYLGTAFNSATRNAAAFFAESRTVADVKNLFADAAATVSNLGQSLQPVLDGLRDIGVVGSHYLTIISNQVGGLAKRFAAWAAEARKSGQLMNDFQTFGRVLTNLGHTLLNIGSIFSSVLGAASTAGGGLLGTLRDLTGQVAAFLRSTQGQSNLTQVFGTLQRIVAALRPGFQAIMHALWQAFQTLAPVLPQIASNFSRLLESVAPILPQLAQLAADILPPLTSALASLGPLLPPIVAGFLALRAAVKGLAVIGGMAAGIRSGSAALKDFGGFATRTKAKVGGFVDRLNNGGTVARGFGKAIGGVGRALPGLSVALGGIGIAVQAFQWGLEQTTGTVDSLAQGFARGGAAAGKAAQQMRDNVDASGSLLTFYQNFGNQVGGSMIPSLNQVTQKLMDQKNVTRDVALAMVNAGDKQAYYQQMVKIFGKNSPAAQSAQNQYGIAVGKVADAENRAKRETESATQKMLDQKTTQLGAIEAQNQYKQAVLGIRTAQNSYNTAVRQYGADSLQAKNAQLNLNNAYIQAVQAAVNSAAAENKNGTAAQKADAKHRAYVSTVLGLAAAAGTNAPPALQKMVNGLSASEIGAYKATGAVNGTHHAVVTLPNGKKIAINVNPNGQAVVSNTQKAIDNLHGKTVQITVKTLFPTLMGGNPSGELHNPLDVINSLTGGHAVGGYINGPGTSTSDSIPARLSDGEYVMRAASVSKYGVGMMSAINMGAFAHGGLAGFASGGLIPAPPTHNGSARTRYFEDQSANYADGWAWDGENGKFINPTVQGKRETRAHKSAQLAEMAQAANRLAAALATLQAEWQQTTQVVKTQANPALTKIGTQIFTGTNPALQQMIANLPPLAQEMILLATTANTSWLGITSRIVGSHNTINASQNLLQAQQNASWTGITNKIVISDNQIAARHNQLNAQTWSAWNGIAGAVASSVGRQLAAFRSLEGGLSGVRAAIGQTQGWAAGQFGAIYGDAANPIRNVLNRPFNAGIIAAWNSINDQFHLDKHVNPVAVTFASGGAVSGPGTGRSDSVPAYLSNGEYVVNAASTARYLPLLEHINARHFADGGLASGLVDPAFKKVPGMIQAVRDSWPGNLAAIDGADIAKIAADDAKKALSKLVSEMSSSFGVLANGAVVSPAVKAEQAYALSQFPLFGWGPDQLGPLIALWNGESGWENKVNPTSGAYGIPQALPGSKMAAAGPDWRTNPATQINWGESYIAGRYGSPAAAFAAWSSRSPHWYGSGVQGAVFDKPTLIGVGESGPEMVDVTPLRGGSRSSAPPITINVFPQPGQSETAIADTVSRRLSFELLGA
ncbi:MAG: hypothetical protein ACRDMV_13205 [Streptosporangiales bacterium]